MQNKIFTEENRTQHSAQIKTCFYNNQYTQDMGTHCGSVLSASIASFNCSYVLSKLEFKRTKSKYFSNARCSRALSSTVCFKSSSYKNL